MRGREQGRYSLWTKGVLCGLVVGMLWGGWVLGQGTVEEAARLNKQAFELYRAGRYQEAIPLAERVLAIMERALDSDHPNVATSLNNLAGLYQAMGAYGQVEPLYQRALAIEERVLGPNHPDVAISLNNLALLYQVMGAYGQAEPFHQRALAIRERTLAILEHALPPDHPDVATSLASLATLYRVMGAYGQAEFLLKRTLALFERTLGSDHPSVATTKGNLGILYLAQGRLEEVYAIFKGKKGSTGLGRYFLLRQDYRAAQEQFQEALAYFQKTGASDPLLASHIGLGLALEGLGQSQEAAETYRRAVVLMEEQRAALAPAQRRHFLRGEVGAGFQRILAYKGLVRVSMQRQEPAEAFGWAEHTKARSLLEILSRGGPTSSLPPALAQQEETLLTRLRSLLRQREVAFTKQPTLVEELEERELPQARQALAQFVQQLHRDYPAYAALTYPQPVPVEALRLQPQEVLLTYEVTDTATFAWLVREGKILTTRTIPVTREALTAQVTHYRGFFEGVTGSPELARFDPREGKQLYDVLVKDVVPFLRQGDQLIVIPDEILGILPFEALVVEVPATLQTASGKYGPFPQGVTYLGDVFPISYAQSATALHLARTLKGAGSGGPEKLLVVADPVFQPTDARLQGKEARRTPKDADQMRLMRAVEEHRQVAFPRLERTGQLPERLRSAYGPAVEALSGLAATEPEVRRRPLRTYKALVFATHGILDAEVPRLQEPALVLSQVGVNAAEPAQDGFLTMSEVMGLDLAAEVVALTACNTGVGKHLTGEGVMGLGRAFQYAGARAVLMSLWSVEEESTVLLTEKFFGYLKQGKGKLEALRHARADIRRAGYEHPFFWAPFLLVGER